MDTPTSAKSPAASSANTRDQLLAHAEKLIRTRGCNGFSYRDLAEHVGVKTSSIHYYFPGKDDLLYEAVEAYTPARWRPCAPSTRPCPRALEPTCR